MDYTRAEIIIECKNHLKKISKKSKKRLREDIDKRNYLISLLYFKFKLKYYYTGKMASSVFYKYR